MHRREKVSHLIVGMSTQTEVNRGLPVINDRHCRGVDHVGASSGARQRARRDRLRLAGDGLRTKKMEVFSGVIVVDEARNMVTVALNQGRWTGA